MNNIFNIEKFNLIEDEENYYFFRSLEPGDLKDLENGIIKENNEYTKLRTDRERWEEEHPGESPRWNSESEVSLEEMYSHIKMHYSLQTNCISLSSNANVARTYGEEFSDKYVMVRVPKKEMGERVFHAGSYMLQELEKIVEKEIEKQNLREDVLEDLKAIDEAKTSDEIKELIKTRYKTKEGIDVNKAGLKKGITYRSPHARISSYQSLNEEQTLEKNRIIGKLTVLERKQAMKPLMARASSNNLLIQTVGSAFSSSEQIYYGDIEGDRITDISKEILDIFGLLQQVEGQDKEIVTELKREVIKFVNEKRQINISKETLLNKKYELKDNITIEEMYELTDGKVEYGIANSIVKNMFYLSKGQLEARQLAEILRNITNNNSKYDKVIEYIEKNGFEIEPKISTRQSNKGFRLSESVNLNLRTNEIPLVEAIKSLSTEEQIEILEKGGLSDTRNIITDTFSRVQRDEKISREEYYAGAIIDSYDWLKIGVEEFTIEQRNDLLKKLKEKDCVEIYKKLQDAGIPEKDIPLYLINIASKEQFSNILTSDNYIELIEQNKEALSKELSIPQIETFLGYYNVEGTEIVLRDYQRNAVEKTDEIFEEKRFASVVLPTGAGKTFVALTELLEHRNEPILYLAPQNEILEQTKDRIIEYIHGKQGTIGKTKDEIIAELFPNIKFETYPGLLAKRGKDVIENNYDFIVLDELHRTGAKEWETKLNELLENQEESTKVLGITATPTRDMDDRNMADDMALKLGYTKEEVQRREHIAMDMDLVDAIKLGLVVNPKIVSCEYTLKTDGSMENLLEKINSIEDEDIRKEKIEQYEKLRRKIDSAQGIPEILKQNIKAGGKYIVFIPITDKGETIEDEDGNEIGKKTGIDKIQEYEQKLEEYLKDSGLNPKCYSMLGAYSDKVNENQLKSFEEDDSEDAKFMIVMNKANEGLHIKGIDGIVWFRALDENSKILYLQQLGRAIYSEDPNNPTPDEKRPVIIDLANNTLNVNIDKDIKNNTRRSDLELLSIVVDWVKLHNGLPNIDSTNKIEQRYAATLYRIQNEYMKYIKGFEQFPDLDEEKKEEIDKILNKGAEIDLWDIELTPNIIQKTNKLLEVNDFEVTGVMRDFTELEKETNKLTRNYLSNAKKILEFVKENGRLPNSKAKNVEEKTLGIALISIRGNLINQYKNERTEEEKYKFRLKYSEFDEVQEIIRLVYIYASPYYKKAKKVQEWMERNNTTKLPSKKSDNEEEKSMSQYIPDIKHKLIKIYNNKKTDKEREEFREEHPEIDEVMQIVSEINKNCAKYVVNARIIEEWAKKQEKERLPRQNSIDEEEKKIYNMYEYINKRIIRPFYRLETEKQKREFIEKNPGCEETIHIINKLKEKEESVSDYLINARKIRQWMIDNNTTKPPSRASTDELEKTLGYAWNNMKQNMINPYLSKQNDMEREEFRKKHPEISEILELVNVINRDKIPDYLVKARNIKNWTERTKKIPSAKGKNEEEKKMGVQLKHLKNHYIKKYMALEKYEERRKFLKKSELYEVFEIITEIYLKYGNNNQIEQGQMIKKDLRKMRTSKEIAEASISSIKDMELADEEDIALQQLVEKSKEGGINKDEQS